MKNLLLVFIALIFCHTGVLAQQDTVSVQKFSELNAKIDSLILIQSELRDSYSEILELTEKNRQSINAISNGFDSLESDLLSNTEEISRAFQQLQGNERALNAAQDELSNLEELINEQSELLAEYKRDSEAKTNELSALIERSDRETGEQIAVLDNSISKTTIYWIVAVSITLLVAIILFFALRRKVESGTDSLINKISATKKDLEEEGLKLDQKLVDILNTQLKLMNEKVDSTQNNEGEIDHSLALKVADEVTRIRMNLDHMDPETKGWKQLDRSARAILNNFQANGYELPELLGKDYSENMNVVATTELDENLETGEQKIKRVVKPQVNYNGKMIQAAQIVVGIGN